MVRFEHLRGRGVADDKDLLERVCLLIRSHRILFNENFTSTVHPAEWIRINWWISRAKRYIYQWSYFPTNRFYWSKRNPIDRQRVYFPTACFVVQGLRLLRYTSSRLQWSVADIIAFMTITQTHSVYPTTKRDYNRTVVFFIQLVVITSSSCVSLTRNIRLHKLTLTVGSLTSLSGHAYIACARNSWRRFD